MHESVVSSNNKLKSPIATSVVIVQPMGTKKGLQSTKKMPPANPYATTNAKKVNSNPGRAQLMIANWIRRRRKR